MHSSLQRTLALLTVHTAHVFFSFFFFSFKKRADARDHQAAPYRRSFTDFRIGNPPPTAMNPPCSHRQTAATPFPSPNGTVASTTLGAYASYRRAEARNFMLTHSVSWALSLATGEVLLLPNSQVYLTCLAKNPGGGRSVDRLIDTTIPCAGPGGHVGRLSWRPRESVPIGTN
jgi:hypothetical protein